jgi:hypothetical protein
VPIIFRGKVFVAESKREELALPQTIGRTLGEVRRKKKKETNLLNNFFLFESQLVVEFRTPEDMSDPRMLSLMDVPAGKLFVFVYCFV